MMNESIEPKKRGRPKLAPKDVKDNYVPMRLNNEDFAAFTEAAQRKGQTLSEWMRLVLRKAAKK
jgi:predicted HicB family RNase H-like nuclease